jgi:hypothetical protein
LTALPVNDPGGADAALDVLSPVEERVLASVRNVVEGLRARGLPAEPDAVAGALGAERVPRASGTQAEGAEYLSNGARFALRRRAGPQGAIEISFILGTP